MRDFVLNESSYSEIKDQTIELVILPWGATEPHNYHLPYGTDSLETTFIAEKASAKAKSKGAKIMMLPAIHLGMQNPGQLDIPFCLHASVQTQLSILRDIEKSLSRQGLNKLIILNGHGGNDFKAIIRDLYQEFDNFFIGLSNWYSILDNNKYFEEPGDHAGEMETSIMMHAFPDLVVNLKNAGSRQSRKFSMDCLNSSEVWTPRDWARVSKDTGIGNPYKTSAERGKKFVEYLTDRLADILNRIAGSEINKLYE